MNIEELYEEFFIENMIEYLEKNSLTDQFFLNKDGFFLMRKYFPKTNSTHAKKLKRFDPIFYCDMEDYIHFECDVENKLVKKKDIDLAYYHYLNATENLFENFTSYIKNLDKKFNNKNLYKQLLNMDFNKNIMPLYWMLKKDTYKDFLQERQLNSEKGYDDYLCHTLFKETSLTERLFFIEMKDDKDGLIIQRLFKNLISESDKINSYSDNKNDAKKMMLLFIAYEFTNAIASSYSPQEVKDNFRKNFYKIFIIENELIRNENQLILKIDNKIFLEYKSIYNDSYINKIINKISVEDDYALLVIEDSDILTGYKQTLSTVKSFVFNINPEMENKKIYMDILEEELELLRINDFSSLEKFNLSIQKDNEIEFGQNIRAKYLSKVLGNKQTIAKEKRKI